MPKITPNDLVPVELTDKERAWFDTPTDSLSFRNRAGGHIKTVTEFADAICADCLNIIANADPDNMGWTPQQYDEWLGKFDSYCEGVELHVCPADYNDPETGPYFTHSGCPICADGLGCDVYPVMVFAF